MRKSNGQLGVDQITNVEHLHQWAARNGYADYEADSSIYVALHILNKCVIIHEIGDFSMRPSGSKVVFSANEAEQITGHSMDSQRNNRRSGYIPKVQGHARYDLFDLFRLAFISDAAKFKIGPQQSHEAAEWVAHHALYFALQVPDVIDADWNALKDANYWPGYSEAFPDHDADDDFPEYAARQLFSGLFERPNIHGSTYGVIWSGGSECFCNSLDQAFGSLDVEDPRFGSPALIIDHRMLAVRILAKIGRPIVKIS